MTAIMTGYAYFAPRTRYATYCALVHVEASRMENPWSLVTDGISFAWFKGTACQGLVVHLDPTPDQEYLGARSMLRCATNKRRIALLQPVAAVRGAQGA